MTNLGRKKDIRSSCWWWLVPKMIPECGEDWGPLTVHSRSAVRIRRNDALSKVNIPKTRQTKTPLRCAGKDTQSGRWYSCQKKKKKRHDLNLILRSQCQFTLRNIKKMHNALCSPKCQCPSWKTGKDGGQMEIAGGYGDMAAKGDTGFLAGKQCWRGRDWEPWRNLNVDCG